MAEPVHKLIDLVGSSGVSVSDAIQNAITRAGATVRNIRWFEVVQVRGGVSDGKPPDETGWSNRKPPSASPASGRAPRLGACGRATGRARTPGRRAAGP